MQTVISRFSATMSQEIDPWTSRERRNIRRVAGNRQAAEAVQFVRQRNYTEALDIYKNIYQQDGGAFAGYNTAVLLQANDNFTDALNLLEDFTGEMEKSGKKNPPFIRREMNRIEGYINGFKILKGYQ